MVTTLPRLRVIATATVVVCLAATSTAQIVPNAAHQRLAADGSRWVVLIDDLHLDFRRTGHVPTAVAAVVRPLYEAGVLAAIRSDGPSALALSADDTTPWFAVSDTIKRITGNALKSSDIVRMLGASSGSRELVHRARQAGATVEALLRESDDRPAVLLLISNGYRTDVPAVSEQLTGMAALTGRALVPVVALDPRHFAADVDLHAGLTGIEARQHRQATTTSLQLLVRTTDRRSCRSGG